MKYSNDQPRPRVPLRRVLPVALLLLVSQFAAAQETFTVGGTKGSKLSFKNYGCGSQYLLVGLEVNYGTDRVAKVRGLCRKIDRDGNLLGNKVPTQWSPLEVGSGYNYSKTVTCPSGYAVTGPLARVTEYSSRFALNAVGLFCRRVIAGGKVTGNNEQVAPVGASGGTSTGATCSSDLPAMSISGTFKNYIESLKMGCGVPEITLTEPDQPTGLTPINSMATGTWSWRAAGGATKYFLLIGTSDNTSWYHFNESVIGNDNLVVKDCGSSTRCSANVPSSFTTANLIWRVEAYNSVGTALSNGAWVGNPNAQQRR